MGNYQVTTTPTTITTTSDTNYIGIQFNKTSITTDDITKCLFQLELGNATDYEPYGEPTWYIEKQIGKVILDGSEDETWYLQSINSYGIANFDILISDYIHGIENLALTNNFKKQTTSISSTQDMGFLLNNNRTLYIRIEQTIANTIADFKTWLSSHNTIVYYVLATPTYTKIENEELVNQLESVLNLYKGVNNITITPQYNNQPLSLKVEFKVGFTHNGLGIITDVLEANVTEQINGDYYLDFRVAINNKLADDLTYNNIISCKVADGTEQFFRIKRVVKTFTEIQIYATHIFYDLIDNVLDNVAPTGLTCADYGRWLLSHTNYWTPFTFNSDMLSWNSGRYIRKNVVESMIGNIDNSMLVKFGGEIVRDNFDIALNYSRGNDNGVVLRIGKNIKQIEITTDIDNMATRIIPVGFDGLMIPEQYIDSPNK